MMVVRVGIFIPPVLAPCIIFPPIVHLVLVRGVVVKGIGQMKIVCSSMMAVIAQQLVVPKALHCRRYH